jgi:hypothetical protein
LLQLKGLTTTCKILSGSIVSIEEELKFLGEKTELESRTLNVVEEQCENNGSDVERVASESI